MNNTIVWKLQREKIWKVLITRLKCVCAVMDVLDLLWGSVCNKYKYQITELYTWNVLYVNKNQIKPHRTET